MRRQGQDLLPKMTEPAPPPLIEQLNALREWWQGAGVDYAFTDEPHEWQAKEAGGAAADSADAVLQLSERITARVDQWISTHAVDDVELPSRWLPSLETQRARQARQRLAGVGIGRDVERGQFRLQHPRNVGVVGFRDVADRMIEGAEIGVGPQLADLGADAGQFGRHHVDAGELLPRQVVGDQDVDKARLGPGVLQDLALARIRQRDDLADAVDQLGDAGIAYDPAALHAAGLPPLGPDDAGGILKDHFYNRASTIFGGSSEIQRNIIAKAVLGL